MHHIQFSTRMLLLVLVVAASSIRARYAIADLNTYFVQSVEWLVDNSDVIAVVEVDADQRKVLHVLKGDATNLKDPLHQVQPTPGYSYIRPRTNGPLRIIFVRNGSEILENVAIPPRSMPFASANKPLHESFLGVTQAGQLILSEAELLDRIRSRVESGPERQLRLRRTRLTPHASDDGLHAPPYFPLENSGETYVLVVPFSASLQEYYMRTLWHGTAEERLYALYGLSHFDTDEAKHSILKAQEIEEAVPSFLVRIRGNERQVVKLDAEDVREKAKTLSEAPMN